MSDDQRVAIFASGTGSNYEAIMEAKHLPCKVVLLVSDQPEALVLEKAVKYNTPTFVFDVDDYNSQIDYEEKILEKLEEAQVDWIFLAGYMRIIGSTLLNKYEGKIVNIHPSLLPSFPGLDAVGQAMDAGVKKTGVTIHYVDAGVDTGPIIAQQSVAITEYDTRETLMEKIHAIEHELYPQTIHQLLVEDTHSVKDN